MYVYIYIYVCVCVHVSNHGSSSHAQEHSNSTDVGNFETRMILVITFTTLPLFYLLYTRCLMRKLSFSDR